MRDTLNMNKIQESQIETLHASEAEQIIKQATDQLMEALREFDAPVKRKHFSKESELAFDLGSLVYPNLETDPDGVQSRLSQSVALVLSKRFAIVP